MELLACALFTDLSGLSQSGSIEPTAGPANDASAPDTWPVVEDDGAPSPDSATTTDAPIAPGDPCSDPAALIGRSDLTGLDVDTIPPYTLDTYPFVASATGVARCLWLYVEGGPPSKKVRVGVYTHDGVTDHPKNLVVGVELENVTVKAWNKMSLPSPITISTGDKYWIGVAPVEREDDAGGVDNITIRFRGGSCAGPFAHVMNIPGKGSLPAVFEADGTLDGDCDGAVYLGR